MSGAWRSKATHQCDGMVGMMNMDDCLESMNGDRAGGLGLRDADMRADANHPAAARNRYYFDNCDVCIAIDAARRP